MPKNVVDQPLTRLSTTVVRDVPAEVVRDGGRNAAGLITGASAITRGEALGHGMWIDNHFLGQVADAINASGASGTKVRFTHPDVSSDGLGKYLGRGVGAAVVEDRVLIKELHFAQSAAKAPDGNLADYVMTLAEESPDAFGMSIVFQTDSVAQSEFYKANIVDGEFVSPDPENVDNLGHARLKTLFGVDVVDEPAANPNGLFHRQNSLAQEATAMAKYVLGISDSAPASVALGLDAGRTRAFVSRFLSEQKLRIEKEPAMSAAVETKPEEVKQDETKPETKPEEVKQDETKPETKPALSAGQKFLDAFGDIGGVWFAQGKSFEDAMVEFCKASRADNQKLSKEVEQLQTRLQAGRKAFSTCTTDGVSFQASDDKPGKKSLAEAVKIVGRN